MLSNIFTLNSDQDRHVVCRSTAYVSDDAKRDINQHSLLQTHNHTLGQQSRASTHSHTKRRGTFVYRASELRLATTTMLSTRSRCSLDSNGVAEDSPHMCAHTLAQRRTQTRTIVRTHARTRQPSICVANCERTNSHTHTHTRTKN